ADDRMRFELARQVAGAFSHYVTYRTDWLQAWQQGHSADPAGSLGQDEPWQQALWQRIATALSLEPVNPLLAFARSLQTRALPQEAFPNPVHIFCLPDIAPLHLELLRALAQHGDLYLYALNPCAEYWFDVVDPRRLAYLQAAGRLDHHQVGHRLLAGWAKQSQAHLRQLVETTEFDLAEATFHPSDSPQLLGRLQDSILHLQELAPGSVPMKAGDRSLEVHVCHSRSRELEVLHDRLLGLFREYPDLSPDQILVVTPDLQATAPLIDAVFGTAPRERHIPYQI
ncbi:MAG: exodeoxyribonuclease V subunit gamma, partial [Quisquiliibacterium sp.]